MIKLQATYDERLKVKELGAHWDGKEKTWYIPDKVDFHPFKEWIPPEEFSKLESLSTPMPLNVFFNVLDKNIKLPTLQYTIEGDVMFLHDLPEYGFSILQLIDQHQYRYPLQVKINQQNIPDDLDLVDKRISLTGTIHFYQKNGIIQFQATDTPIILGSCLRIAEKAALAIQFKSILTAEKNEKSLRQRMMDLESISEIGIIAPHESRGYNDFFNHLKSTTHDQFSFIDIRRVADMDGPMDVSFIVKSLKFFNESYPYLTCICIVRGGGNPEEFCIYNSPELLTTINESKIPIITGIGHDDDILLCDELAAYNAGTPTGAAEKLNEFASARLKKERYAKQKEMASNKSATINWKQLYMEMEYDNVTLRAENQSLREKLEQSRKKGFFSRLFG